MAPLTIEEINNIAQKVAVKLKSFSGESIPADDPQIGQIKTSETGMRGVFLTIDKAVDAAKKAQEQFISLKLSIRKTIISNIRKKMLENAKEIAKIALQETEMGRLEDKVLKNELVAGKTPGIEMLTPTAFSGDNGLTLIERAPFGVIGAITPSTNPTSTIICNTIGMIAAGNSVVFNAHPSAKRSSIYTIHLLNEAIINSGGPENLITTVKEPTIETAGELMHHEDIGLLVVTGGEGVVKAAMKSGKRAICAGPGNPPVIVDETADIKHAATCIVDGASLDNNIICVLEKEIIVVNSVKEELISELAKNNALILTSDQIEKLEKIIFSETFGAEKPAVINKKFVGKDIKIILKEIGMNIDDKIKLAVAPVEESHPLVWTEQLMPVIPIVGVPDCNYAIDFAIRAERGFRHTAIMHSKNIDRLSKMAKEINSSIFVKNGPSYSGLGFGGEGFCSFSIASPTGEGITNPVSFSRERRCVLVDHFRIV